MKKSRAVYASFDTYQGLYNMFYLVIPYDKKGREIPTSVNCAFNATYYSEREAMKMAGAL